MTAGSVGGISSSNDTPGQRSASYASDAARQVVEQHGVVAVEVGATLDARQDQQVLDQPVEPVGLVGDARGELAVLGVVGDAPGRGARRRRRSR